MIQICYFFHHIYFLKKKRNSRLRRSFCNHQPVLVIWLINSQSFFIPILILKIPGLHITGCPGQPFRLVGQPKIDPWLPCRPTKSFVIYLCKYIVGQPKCPVGQPRFNSGCPTGQPIFKTNVKPGIHKAQSCSYMI